MRATKSKPKNAIFHIEKKTTIAEVEVNIFYRTVPLCLYRIFIFLIFIIILYYNYNYTESFPITQ